MTRSSFAVPAKSLTMGTLWATFTAVWQVARERRALARLDARTLADIGLSDEAAAAEAGRALWDLPANR